MGGRSAEGAKLGRFRDADAGLVLIKALIVAHPDLRRQKGIARRKSHSATSNGSPAFCCDKTADPDRSALAHELCALAVERFCEPRPAATDVLLAARSAGKLPFPKRRCRYCSRRLRQAVRDEDLSRVIHFVQGSPDEFSLDDCQVPCLKSLIPWSRKQFGSVHPATGVLAGLRPATARIGHRQATGAAGRLGSPSGRGLPCQYCAQLKAFLADPANEVGRIPAREDDAPALLLDCTLPCDPTIARYGDAAHERNLPLVTQVIEGIAR